MEYKHLHNTLFLIQLKMCMHNTYILHYMILNSNIYINPGFSMYFYFLERFKYPDSDSHSKSDCSLTHSLRVRIRV